MKKLYVGNIPFSMNESDVENLFAEHGSVASVALITDRETGRPRGFGFVEMNDAAEADKAAEALNGRSVEGRALVVNEARERTPGGGGGRRGGGGGGRW